MDIYDRNERVETSLKQQQALHYTHKYLNLMNSATENHPAFKIGMNFREKIEVISKFFFLTIMLHFKL